MFQHTAARRRLAYKGIENLLANFKFQHTAARRRLVNHDWDDQIGVVVSTHSRPKAAGIALCGVPLLRRVSTHSRPKAAGPNHHF